MYNVCDVDCSITFFKILKSNFSTTKNYYIRIHENNIQQSGRMDKRSVVVKLHRR